MTDINEHKWSDENLEECEVWGSNLQLSAAFGSIVQINKNDSTAIAKHFHDLMSIDEKIDFWNIMFKDNDLGIGKLSKIGKVDSNG